MERKLVVGKDMETQETNLSKIVNQHVLIETSPNLSYKFDHIKVGVLKDVDREYTYDVIPHELENGILFQTVHRVPLGTSTKLTVLKECTIYFIFHNIADGNYTEILKGAPEWSKCNSAPQYDIYGIDGDPTHGLDMNMYKLEAKPGTYHIPPGGRSKASDWSCWNIVVNNIDKLK